MASPKTEKWLIMAANPNQQWDMNQGRLTSNPVVTLNMVQQGPNNTVMPGMVRQINVTEAELADYPPGQYVTVTLTPPGPGDSSKK